MKRQIKYTTITCGTAAIPRKKRSGLRNCAGNTSCNLAASKCRNFNTNPSLSNEPIPRTINPHRRPIPRPQPGRRKGRNTNSGNAGFAGGISPRNARQDRAFHLTGNPGWLRVFAGLLLAAFSGKTCLASRMDGHSGKQMGRIRLAAHTARNSATPGRSMAAKADVSPGSAACSATLGWKGGATGAGSEDGEMIFSLTHI